jgi:hypothetical protein
MQEDRIGPLFAIVLTAPLLDNCPSAKMGCPICSLAIAYLRPRHHNQNDGPNGANQLFSNLLAEQGSGCNHL